MDRLEKVLLAGPVSNGSGYDRGPKLFRQLFNINLNASPLCHIHHVQIQHKGDLHFQQLERKVEVSFQIRGICYVDHHRGLFVEEKVPRYPLFK